MRQFLGWVFSLGEDIKIVGPDDVVEQMNKEIIAALDNNVKNTEKIRFSLVTDLSRCYTKNRKTGRADQIRFARSVLKI